MKFTDRHLFIVRFSVSYLSLKFNLVPVLNSSHSDDQSSSAVLESDHSPVSFSFAQTGRCLLGIAEISQIAGRSQPFTWSEYQLEYHLEYQLDNLKYTVRELIIFLFAKFLTNIRLFLLGKSAYSLERNRLRL